MDPDHLLVVEVDAHLDRALAAARAAPSPADARADRAVEVARVQAGVDLRQVVYAPARRERRLRPRRERPDELPVLANVLVDGAAVSAPVATRETGERPHHRLVRPREHVMEPETQTTLHAPVADHRPGVIGQLHLDRLAQQRSKPRCEDEARAVGHDMDARRTGLWIELDGDARLGPRSELAGEEGELPHACGAL